MVKPRYEYETKKIISIYWNNQNKNSIIVGILPLILEYPMYTLATIVGTASKIKGISNCFISYIIRRVIKIGFSPIILSKILGYNVRFVDRARNINSDI
jgi:hypothetical protein